MKLHTIHAGLFKLDGGAMFGVVPKSIWNRLNPADANNLCTWALRCLLVEDGGRLILIDTGMGDKQDPKFFSHYDMHGDDTLERSLSAAGFGLADITDVFLSHLHFDHCGGCIVRSGDGMLIPAFPFARYHVNAEHWDWATHPNAREKASFLPENILPMQEAGKLELIALPGAETSTPSTTIPEFTFAENFDVRVVNGHTRGMLLPQLAYKGRSIVFMADLLPSVSHIPLPYVMAYDMFPLTTLEEKKMFLQEAVEKELVLYFEHDPVNECCTVHQTDKGIRVKEVFKLEDL